MTKTHLMSALAAAGRLSATSQVTRSYDRRPKDTDEDEAGKRMTSVNYEEQKRIHEAAIAKRLRRQARNLSNADQSQGELL